ncbi:hypothetical protein [Peribacillus acanthi]|uniref:hypothetical protein n=1 Tax=Peribacillus acanthi TaxID=2171554 RepID=UPI000D3E2902|nr:hypothetical protein [Peribacillus acanthi]
MNYRHLSKTGQIFIQKRVLNQVGFNNGDYLFIYNVRESIYIENQNNNQSLNKCILHNGRVSIPAEIRRLMKVTSETLLEIEIPEGINRIVINIQNNI